MSFNISVVWQAAMIDWFYWFVKQSMFGTQVISTPHPQFPCDFKWLGHRKPSTAVSLEPSTGHIYKGSWFTVLCSELMFLTPWRCQNSLLFETSVKHSFLLLSLNYLLYLNWKFLFNTLFLIQNRQRNVGLILSQYQFKCIVECLPQIAISISINYVYFLEIPRYLISSSTIESSLFVHIISCWLFNH